MANLKWYEAHEKTRLLDPDEAERMLVTCARDMWGENGTRYSIAYIANRLGVSRDKIRSIVYGAPRRR